MFLIWHHKIKILVYAYSIIIKTQKIDPSYTGVGDFFLSKIVIVSYDNIVKTLAFVLVHPLPRYYT